MNVQELKPIIEATWDDLSKLYESRWEIEETVDLLDQGLIRTAECVDGTWSTNQWVKKAIILWLKLRGHANIQVRADTQLSSAEHGAFGEFRMKSLKRLERVWMPVPATIRHGSYVGDDVRLSPCFVNMGAWIGPRGLIANGAGVGFCAQVGADVWLSSEATIGSVMIMPLHSKPVIIEDGVYIGMHCVVSEGTDPYFAGPATTVDEGVVVGTGAVLGAGVVINGATPIIDFTGTEPREIHGGVPPHAVVVRGTTERKLPAGTCQVGASFIVGWRDSEGDPQKTLYDALRKYSVES